MPHFRDTRVVDPEEVASSVDQAFGSLLDGTLDWHTVDHRTGADGMAPVYD